MNESTTNRRNEMNTIANQKPLNEAQRESVLRCTALLGESPTFKHVLDFAFRMESKLAKNRHKGDREGWLKDNPWNLVERILDETVEVQECFMRGGEHGNDVTLCKTPEETADECADTANFCMMVADRVTYSPNAALSQVADKMNHRLNHRLNQGSEPSVEP